MAKDLGAIVLSNYNSERDPDDAVTLLDELLKGRQLTSADIFALMSASFELGKEEFAEGLSLDELVDIRETLEDKIFAIEDKD